MTERFSDREGYRPPAAPITIREDAPPELRSAILVLAEEAGMTPGPHARSDLPSSATLTVREHDELAGFVCPAGDQPFTSMEWRAQVRIPEHSDH